MDEKTLAEIVATAEVMGAQLSSTAVDLMADDLSSYPADSIRQALSRLRQDGARFNVAEIINRLPGMWPGAEIAWATAPRDEALTVITTPEALGAWDIAQELDGVAGRMAFNEAYRQAVAQARARGESPKWMISVGHDVALRDQVILDGVKDCLISPKQAHVRLAHIPIEGLEQLAIGQTTTHALIESHQATISNLDQLMIAAPEEVLTSREDARANAASLRDLLRDPVPTPEAAEVFDSELEKHKAQVKADLASMKRLAAVPS